MHNRWHCFFLLHWKSWLPSSRMKRNNLYSAHHAGHTVHVITALVISSVPVIFWLQCSGLYTVGGKFEWRASRIGVLFLSLASCHFPQWHLNTQQYDHANLIQSFSHIHTMRGTQTQQPSAVDVSTTFCLYKPLCHYLQSRLTIYSSRLKWWSIIFLDLSDSYCRQSTIGCESEYCDCVVCFSSLWFSTGSHS